jgi:hypothetical protein
MTASLQELPVFPEETIKALSSPELLSLLIENEDRVARNVIEECARRGADMTETLSVLIEEDRYWSDEALTGEWWALLHAAMILGLIPGERSGLLLVEFMRRMAEEEDENLQEWVGNYWPAFFRNKPESVLPALRAVSEDRGLDWYPRLSAMEAVVSRSEVQGAQALEAALAWVAGIASTEGEDRDLRLFAANTLVGFPRPEYRPLLDDFVKRQKHPQVVFSGDDVRNAYSEGRDRPEWERFANPWRDFYAPVAIERRQERWAEEESGLGLDDSEDELPDEPMVPYVRGAAKVGRNDPCPCGSGRKYKRCCLPNEQA